MLFDDLGNTLAHASAPEPPGPSGFVPPPDMSAYLRKDSKTRARRTLNPWLVGDHTKLLVFDQQVAIIGGMNIGREYYSEWHDLMVRVEGPIVRSLSREFNLAWGKAGPLGDLAIFYKPAILQSQTSVTGEIPLRILRTDVTRFSMPLCWRFVESANASGSSIPPRLLSEYVTESPPKRMRELTVDSVCCFRK